MKNPLTPASEASDDEQDEEESNVDLSDPLQRQFVYLVVVFNVAVLAAAVGLMVLYFRGQLLLGSCVALLGFAGLAYGLYTYRGVRREIDAGVHDAPEDADADEPA